MTSTRTSSTSIDITVFGPARGRMLSISVSPQTSLADILRSAAARFHLLDGAGVLPAVHIRRRGSTVPLNPDQPAGDCLNGGDRLVVERVSDRVGSQKASGGDDGFGAAAAEASREALSGDSAQFLRRARQVRGE